jgi:hypothetical protein
MNKGLTKKTKKILKDYFKKINDLKSDTKGVRGNSSKS